MMRFSGHGHMTSGTSVALAIAVFPLTSMLAEAQAPRAPARAYACEADFGVRIESKKTNHEIVASGDAQFAFGLVHYSFWPTEGMRWTPGIDGDETDATIRKAWEDRFYTAVRSDEATHEKNAYLFVSQEHRPQSYTMHSPNGCVSTYTASDALEIKCENGGDVLRFYDTTGRFEFSSTSTWSSGTWDDVKGISSPSGVWFGQCEQVPNPNW